VAEDVVVVNRLLAQQAARDLFVDDSCSSCCVLQQRPSVEPAHDLAVHLDDRAGRDDLQIEDRAARRERSPETTQDVHDVLPFHTSERPGEHHEVEFFPWNLDLARRADLVGHNIAKVAW
jgi:hypothetical protein